MVELNQRAMKERLAYSSHNFEKFPFFGWRRNERSGLNFV